MILNGEINSHGVFPPEGCPDLNLDRMKRELEKRNITIKKKII